MPKTISDTLEEIMSDHADPDVLNPFDDIIEHFDDLIKKPEELKQKILEIKAAEEGS